MYTYLQLQLSHELHHLTSEDKGVKLLGFHI